MAARDVFLCHASSNKPTHARPLFDALTAEGISSWLDEAMIEPGESIVDAVSQGLQLAQYVLPIVTNEMIDRAWTKRELNAAFSRELRLGRRIIVPVIDIDRDVWFQKFPLLEDKLYLSWSEGPEQVARRLAAMFDRRPASEWVFEHPADHVGPIWLRCVPLSSDIHTITLRWGPLVRTVEWGTKNSRPWTMIHHKSRPDSLPLHVSVNPPAIFTAGQGPSPDSLPYAFNIDEGWTRAAGAPITPVESPSSAPLSTERETLADQLYFGEDPVED